MKSLLDIQRQLTVGEFEFSRHAFRRTVERNISERKIQEAGAKAEIIEDYPNDKYLPSSLCFGFTAAGRSLHFQVSYDKWGLTKIITIYEPDQNEWIDYRKRR